MNQFYNIWNHDYIQQQAQAEHHYSQIKQVQDTVKALNDFWMDLTKSNQPIKMSQMRSFARFLLHILIGITEANLT